MKYFLLINFDGFNLGLKSDFNETYIELDDFIEAALIADHWSRWIEGEDI